MSRVNNSNFYYRMDGEYIRENSAKDKRRICIDVDIFTQQCIISVDY